MFTEKELRGLFELLNRVELRGNEAVITGHLLQKIAHLIQREAAPKLDVPVKEPAAEEPDGDN